MDFRYFREILDIPPNLLVDDEEHHHPDGNNAIATVHTLSEHFYINKKTFAMCVHRGKCVVSILRASFWSLKNFTFSKILILGGSARLGGLGAPKMSLGIFYKFPKLRGQNGARRNGTTHLPRCIRFQSTLILIRKHLRCVCTVANALHPPSEHDFDF